MGTTGWGSYDVGLQGPVKRDQPMRWKGGEEFKVWL